MTDFAEIVARIDAAKALFVDWDGCVFQNHKLILGADRFLKHYAEKIFILSNNSTDLPTSFVDLLEPAGAHIAADRIILAGHQTVLYAVARHYEDRIFMIANKEMREFAEARKLNLVGQNADVVLLFRDLDFNYAKLRAAANMVRRGAKLIAANPDMTHPTDDGVVPETGALLAAIQACLGDQNDVAAILGKPSTLLFETALLRAKVDPEDVVMIGDNPQTDIKGAQAIGIYPVLIDPKKRITLSTIMDFGRPPETGDLAFAAAE